MNMQEMREVDITEVNSLDLVDIRDVQIDKKQKPQKRLENYVQQIKNPYCYKYGDYIVKISFEDTTVTLAERLKELILKTASAM